MKTLNSNWKNKKSATAFHEVVALLYLGKLWGSRKREENNEERMGSIEAICFGNNGSLVNAYKEEVKR